MGMDKRYSDLSLITKGSILNTSSNYTFIHLHILAINFEFPEMKKIIDLKRINKSVEFIFYNAKQLVYDFDNAKRIIEGLLILQEYYQPK